MKRSDAVFGREAELAAVQQMLSRALDRPHGISIEGGPGIGKTTVWQRGVELAREQGYRVLASAPREPDATLAFAGLGDLFAGVSERSPWR
jgi:hypothetical protein